MKTALILLLSVIILVSMAGVAYAVPVVPSNNSHYSNNSEVSHSANTLDTRVKIITVSENITGFVNYTYDDMISVANTGEWSHLKINGVDVGVYFNPTTTYSNQSQILLTNLISGDIIEVWVKTRMALPIYIKNFNLRYDNGSIVLNTTLNEGSGSYANDTSGFNNNGTITGATWSTNLVNGSVSGTALSFDGTNDDVTIPTSASLNLTSSGAISVWVKPRTLPSSYNTIVSKGHIDSYNDAYVLWMNPMGSQYQPIFDFFKSTGGNDNIRTGGTPKNLNYTEYILAQWDGSNIYVYQNNIFIASTPQTFNAIPANVPVTICTFSSGSNDCDAVIDELKIYNYALNSSERTSLYQEFHPVPAYPVGGLTISTVSPPMTTVVPFSWHDTVYPSDELIVAKDAAFNIIVADIYTSADAWNVTLEPGTYFWKVYQYNGSTSTYGKVSATQTFTLSSTSSAAAGTGFDGTVYEIISGTNTPISGVNLNIYNNTWSSDQITGTNGYYLFTGLANSSTYYITATKNGYDPTIAYPITTGNGTVITNNILMKLYISPYVPNFVFETFVIRGLFDNPYPGLTLKIFKGSDAQPSYTLITDSLGQTVAQLIKDQYYRGELSGTGITPLTFYFYGKEEIYLITIASGFPTKGDRGKDIIASLTSSVFNATYNNLSLSYNDTRLSTTALLFYAKNLTTNTTCSLSSAAQVASLNCTVLASGTYQFGFNATSSIYGIFIQDKIINFGTGNTSNPNVPLKPPNASTGVPPVLAHWASIMMIVLIGALFSVRSIKMGAVVVPAIALVMWAGFGWLYPVTLYSNQLVIGGLLSIAMIVGVLVYIRMSESKVT